MPQIIFRAHIKRNPAGVRHEAMPFRQTLFQKLITDGARKGNLYRAIVVHVSDFEFSQAKSSPSKAVRLSRDTWPRGNLFFQRLQIPVHLCGTPWDYP